MNDVRHLETLASRALPEGGWGYSPDQKMGLEPTCLALLALSLEPERYAAAIAGGRKALEACRRPEGTYVLARGREEAIWPTALVLFVQSVLGYPAEDARRTTARLLALRGDVPEDPGSAEMHDMDVRLVGWSWAEGTFSWVEPTAWACLALRAVGQGDHPRVGEGLSMLLDRAQDRGGVNYGNRIVFGLFTDPIPGPTAIMLLALQGRQATPRVAAAIRYMEDQTHGPAADVEHLSWVRLALDVWKDEKGPDGLPLVTLKMDDLDRQIEEAARARAQVVWARPTLVPEALTALALAAARRNVFRLPANAASSPPPPAAPPRRRSLGDRIVWGIRGFALNAVSNMGPTPPHSQVHVAAVSDYNADLVDVLRRQYELFRKQVPLAGKRVVLKPNLVEWHRDKVINTNPKLIAAAIELCRSEGAAEVIVGEGPGHWRNADYLVEASGLGEVLKHYKVPFVDLNHDEPIRQLNRSSLTKLHYVYVARTVMSADVVISMPKLKTHHWAGATLSLKNLFGIVPGICYGWPKNELHWRGIHQSIVDIAVARPPHLAIVDGIVGMEGDGPLNGTPLPLGALIMGADLLAVDATCCRLMKLLPERVGYLVLGHQKKLGNLSASAIVQMGESIDSLARPFDVLPHFQQIRAPRPA